MSMGSRENKQAKQSENSIVGHPVIEVNVGTCHVENDILLLHKVKEYFGVASATFDFNYLSYN